MTLLSKKNVKNTAVVAAATAVTAFGVTCFYYLQVKGYKSHVALLLKKWRNAVTDKLDPKGAAERKKKAGIRPVATVPQRGFTKEELAEYDGVKNEKIYMSVKLKVYEVAPHFYGPGQHYHVFAAKESSRPLAKSVLNNDEANKTWEGCTPEELETLEEYVTKFDEKYPVVGWFIPDQSFYEV